jgi:hypothetical protein
MQPLIQYTVRAEISQKDTDGRFLEGDKCRACREIMLKPLGFATPPLEISDLPGDYRLSSTKTLKKSLWGKSIGNLEVSATEPIPLNLATEAPRSASVVALKVVFNPQDECAMKVRPFEWGFQVETKILALTFCSTRPLKQEPSLNEVRTKKFLKVDCSMINPETRIVSDASLGLRRLSQHGMILPDQSPSWSTAFEIPINASKDILPTFLTHLASRRYALRVSIRVLGLHHQPLELQIPLQVNIEPPGINENDLDQLLLGQDTPCLETELSQVSGFT